jgi:uncharacterized protein YoxC
MTIETLWAILAVSAVVIAVALAIVALVALLVARDARRTLRSLDAELAPTLRQARETTASMGRLATDLQARIERLDRLADETEATLVAVRGAADSAQTFVRGPADVVEGARRTAESVGRGILTGADRLRRRMAGDDDGDRDEEAVGE